MIPCAEPYASVRAGPTELETTMDEGRVAGKAGTVAFLQSILGLLARLAGVVLLIVGLWTGIQVMGEAWNLRGSKWESAPAELDGVKGDGMRGRIR